MTFAIELMKSASLHRNILFLFNNVQKTDALTFPQGTRRTNHSYICKESANDEGENVL